MGHLRASATTSRVTVGARRPPGRGEGPRVWPRGEVHPGPTPHEKAQSVAPMSRRLRLSVTSLPGGRGAKPPARLRGTMESGPTGQTRPGNPPPVCGGLRQGPQASAWGLAARKDAVWAEGLADGAPQARPGHHQAASCGLRRCRELRPDFLRSAEKVRRRA